MSDGLFEPEIREAKPQTDHEELMEMLGGMFVQLSRIYDVLLLEANNGQEIDEVHKEGNLYGSAPQLREDAWDAPVQEEES